MSRGDLLLPLAVALAGCPSIDSSPGNYFRCASQADCLAGQRCDLASHYCQPTSVAADAGSPSDAGPSDAGSTDAGTSDAGPSDAGPRDGGGTTADGGPEGRDAGPHSVGPLPGCCATDAGPPAPAACSAAGGLLADPAATLLHVGESQASSPRQLGASDFNGDGLTDLVVGDGEGSVELLLGLGDGGFRALLPITSQAVSAMAIGDFNGDCLPDVAFVAGSRVFVLLGRGDGGFEPMTPGLPIDNGAGGGAVGLVAGDVNRDGKADLIVAESPGGVIGVLLGEGDGGFRAPALYSAGASVGGVALADLNGDGWLDVAASAGGPSGALEAALLLNEGEGGGGSFASAVLLSSGETAAPTGIVATDLNGDGWPDLALTESGLCRIAVLLGAGDGGFPSVSEASAVPSSQCVTRAPGPLLVADLNGDGAPDLIVLETGGPGVDVLVGDGRGGFAPGSRLAIGETAQPGPTAAVAWAALASTPPGNLAVAAAKDGPANDEGTVTMLTSPCP